MFHVKHKKGTHREGVSGGSQNEKEDVANEEERKECVKSSSPSAIYNIPQRADIVNLKNQIF